MLSPPSFEIRQIFQFPKVLGLKSVQRETVQLIKMFIEFCSQAIIAWKFVIC